VGVSDGLMGTVDVAKLGANVDTIQMLGFQAGNVVFTNAPSTFTFQVDGFNPLGADVTIQGPAGSSDVLNIRDQLFIGRIEVTGYETVNFTASADEGIRSIKVNSSPGLVSKLNIINDSSDCGCSFNIEIVETVDIGAGTINISGTGTGGVAFDDFVTAGALNASLLNVTAAPDVPGVGMAAGATGSISIRGSNGSDFLVGSTAADVIDGRAGNDIITNAPVPPFSPVPAAGDTITGDSGEDIFCLVNNAASAAIATAYGNAPLITDFIAGPDAFSGDLIMLIPDAAAYGVSNLQATFSGPGDIPLQFTGSSGTAAIIDATNEIVKLTQNTGTAGLTLQQAFDAAIGTATITGTTAMATYFFTMYDNTNGRVALGIVDTTNTTDTVIEAGDTVVLVGTLTMTAGAYATLNSNQFVFDVPS
jgi:hypothetical protein